MKRITKVTVPVILLVLALSSPKLFAEEPTGKKPGCKDAMKQKMVEDLGLTEEQQAKLGENRKTDHAYVKGLMESLKASRSQLREELNKYNSDPAKVETFATEIKNTQAKLVDHRIASISKIKEIFTAEQFAKFQEKCNVKKGKFMKGPGGHKMGRMQGRMGNPGPEEAPEPEEGLEAEL